MTRCPQIQPVKKQERDAAEAIRSPLTFSMETLPSPSFISSNFASPLVVKKVESKKIIAENFNLHSHGPSLSQEIVILLTSQSGVLRELLDFFFGNNTCACSHLKYLLVTDDKYDTVRMTIRQLKFNEEQGSKMQSVFTALLNTAVMPNLQKRRRPEWVEIRVIQTLEDERTKYLPFCKLSNELK